MAEKKHQNVEDVLSESEAFIMKNKKALISAVVAIVVIIGGYMLYKNFYAAPREEKAQAAMFKGEQLFEQDEFAKALNGDSTGFAGFLKVEDQYSGTKAAKLIKAYIGLCYAHLNQPDKALPYLTSFSSDDQLVGPAVMAAAGDCYTTLGQVDKGTEMFLKAADKAESQSLSPIYLIKAGLNLQSQGKYDEAIKAFQQVKDKYFQSYQAQDIDKYIERAKMMKK